MAKKTKSADSEANAVDSTSFDYEGSLKSLENLVAALEKGDLSLEQSLQTFEQGIHLTRKCQQALDRAEQQIKILDNDGATVNDAKPDADE